MASRSYLNYFCRIDEEACAVLELNVSASPNVAVHGLVMHVASC